MKENGVVKVIRSIGRFPDSDISNGIINKNQGKIFFDNDCFVLNVALIVLETDFIFLWLPTLAFMLNVLRTYCVYLSIYDILNSLGIVAL